MGSAEEHAYLALGHLISGHRLGPPLFLEPLSPFPQASPTTEAQDLKETNTIVVEVTRGIASACGREFSPSMAWHGLAWHSGLTECTAWWETLVVIETAGPRMPPPLQSCAEHNRNPDNSRISPPITRNFYDDNNTKRLCAGLAWPDRCAEPNFRECHLHQNVMPRGRPAPGSFISHLLVPLTKAHAQNTVDLIHTTQRVSVSHQTNCGAPKEDWCLPLTMQLRWKEPIRV